MLWAFVYTKYLTWMVQVDTNAQNVKRNNRYNINQTLLGDRFQIISDEEYQKLELGEVQRTGLRAANIDENIRLKDLITLIINLTWILGQVKFMTVLQLD